MAKTKKEIAQPDAQDATASEVMSTIAACKAAQPVLASSPLDVRNRALTYAAQEIRAAGDEILAANKHDLESAVASKDSISQSMVDRLKLDAAKLAAICVGLEKLAETADPLGHVSLATEIDQGLELYKVTCPLGLIAVIFESRPDALPQISGLCLKSGNAVVLKGGKEARETNRVLFRCMQTGCVKAGLSDKCLALIESRQAVESLLEADRYVDLIVPRGSNELVRHIQNNTRIPVLGHADGLCHLYIDKAADLDKSVRVAIDSKVQYPAACNSVETLLVHEDVAAGFLNQVIPQLIDKGVELRLDDTALNAISESWRAQVKPASPSDWTTEYCDMILSVKLVATIENAIDHINRFGSHHTDAIMTEDKSAFELFFKQVDSAGVYWNASTRFADGFRYGFGAEVGISTGKLHPRGPVGLDGLVTYKYKVVGKGHIAADYVGENAKQFSHKQLDQHP